MANDYLFVHANGGWWLKITDPEQLIDYHKQTQSRYSGAWELFSRLLDKAGDVNKIVSYVCKLPMEERFEIISSRDWQLLNAALIQAQNVEGNIFDGFRCLNIELGFNRLRTIREHGAVFINSAGGHTFGLEYTQFVRRKTLVFPNFKLSDIRVKQFQGGTHFYAYIGDMQVRDKDTLKWYSYDEAYTKAKEVIQCN